jgi:hypothetical protein
MRLWHLLLTQLYVMVTFVAHSVICHGDICCSLSYMSWWPPWHITEWVTNVTMTYNRVSNKCHHDIYLSEQQMSPWHITEWANGDICCSLSYMSWWHLLFTQLYVMVTFVAHSVICDGDICCSLSYMSSNVTITYSWVSNKCHHDI